MKNKIESFLKFNDELILFLNKDGVYWISLPSLCQALKIDASRSYKNAKSDPIIGPALAIQPVQVPGKAGIQLRKVTCIPEFLVYGWIFSVNSDSPELLEYKRECYKLLYDHFHGLIAGRKDLLIEKAIIQKEESELMLALLQDERYTRLDKLRRQKKSIVSKLSQNDQSVIESQRSLWFNEGENSAGS
jgi:hypothetical protein